MNNAKEHVKLYKSKKVWVAAVVTAAALGVTGVSVSNVDADVLPASIVKSEPASVKDGQQPNDKVAANMQYNTGVDPLTDHALKDETPAQQQKAKDYMDEINGTSVSNSKKQTVASSNVVSSSSKVQASSTVSNGGTTAGPAKVSDKVAANLDYSRGIDPLTDQALKDETPAQQQLAKEYVDALNNGESAAEAKVKLGIEKSSKASMTVKKASGAQVTSVSKEENGGQAVLDKKDVNNSQTVNKNVNSGLVRNNQAESASGSKSTLPTTGESQSQNVVALGMGSVLLGLTLGGLSFFDRKKNN